MELAITQAMLDAARAAGACNEGVEVSVGANLFALSQEYLDWCDREVPEVVAEELAECEMPLMLQSTDGYGSGSGYGSGFGFGFGYGDGYGSGYGYGYGYGYGSGYGDGYGSGDGFGYG